jgi:PAS domain-containing protein
VHISASLVRNEKGEPICLMDSFVDITDRKRMEEELKIKDFAIASSINGIAIGDLEGNLTYVNESFIRLWGGKDPSEVLGKSVLTYAQSPEEANSIFNTVLEKGNWFGEIVAKKKDGRPLRCRSPRAWLKMMTATPYASCAPLSILPSVKLRSRNSSVPMRAWSTGWKSVPRSGSRPISG